jgi:hypothetical protein
VKITKPRMTRKAAPPMIHLRPEFELGSGRKLVSVFIDFFDDDMFLLVIGYMSSLH